MRKTIKTLSLLALSIIVFMGVIDAKSIISMAQRLGYETIAEGVETKEQYEYLKSIDCDTIQGFLIGKPKTNEEMEILLSKQM